MSQNIHSQYGSSVIKFTFPCGGVCHLRVTQDTKQKFEAEPEYRAEMIGKAHQHFLKQKAEKQLIEEKKKIEEEKEKEMEKQQEETFRRSDNESQGENMPDEEAIGAPLPGRSIIEVPSRSHCASRVVVDGAMIRVLPKNAGPTRGDIAKARGSKRKATTKPTPTVPSQRQTAEAEHSIYDHDDVHINDDPMVQEDEADESDSEETTVKWSVRQTALLLDTFQQFKPQLDQPYSKKLKIWQKMTKAEGLVALGRTPAQLSKKIYNLKRTWRLMRRPGADSKAWRWTDRMNEIFGEDATIKLLHVAEVNDGGGKEKLPPHVDNSARKKIDWKADILVIEKERVEVLKEMVSGQAQKNAIFDRLTSAIEKIAEK
ncbi:hypothetical protein OUZ56_010561 [Daphnia magna]|uniref:Myb/SANT-like DNA-binding domain-containing protein n=1 Tax=Daphnia magna TaxID=35525 RepID=A0ABR0AIW8_9CRUS|nr:hypothetical protein OUZ56_010561 [Daphnia magna]